MIEDYELPETWEIFDGMTNTQFAEWLREGEFLPPDHFMLCLESVRRDLEFIEDYEKCQILVDYITEKGLHENQL